MEQDLLLLGAVFFAGLAVGIVSVLLFNKTRTGSVSAVKLKEEMEDYQNQVEEHFEQTSEKFKQMANQYQDLYQHLSVGATTLCRSEKIAAGLTDQSNPLSAGRLEQGEPATQTAADEPLDADHASEKDGEIKAGQTAAEANVEDTTEQKQQS